MTERTIFLDALDIADPAERKAYLDGACASNGALRRQVEALLAAHEREGSFLEPPAAAPLPGPALHTPAFELRHLAEGPGTVIGPYKLLEQIGEGGFGVVFLAEQQQPVRRKVALKVLKPGMDTRQVVARFEAERQALALMDHPHIAHVFDGGETTSGRPYFVMELVRGIPITDFCDQEHLPVRARLELFVTVCQAVQHAHQKGIIHRDLKPSNLMVTLHDDKAVVKVIDFGIAKATGQQLTEKTLFTNFGQLIGTPLYMSPEQAQLSGLDIDTRTDIYALGVLLYELLTGTTPFDKERLKTAGFDEIRRIIREEDPPKPSTRLTTLGQASETVSANRRTDPKRLKQLCRGELDWIVMKALEKDRNRRYETASAFAADVQRYLHDEPVQACPPSAGYRLRKFARRNRGPVLAATLVFLATLGGIGGAMWGLITARAAAEEERQAKVTAQGREEETNAVLEFVEDKVFAAARPEGQDGGLGRDVQLRQAIEAALPFVEESFTQQPLIEARLRMTLGASFLYLGEARLAAEQCEKARALYTEHRGPDHPDTLSSMSVLARSYLDLGRHTDGLKLHEETLALRKARLGPDHPDTLRSMAGLASCYHRQGRYAEAVKLLEETLALRQAKLGPDHPDTLSSMHNLGGNLARIGRLAEGLKLQEEVLAIRKARWGPHHPNTLASMYSVAIRYNALGRDADALKLHEETLALRQAKLGPDHRSTLGSMNDVAWSLATIADLKLRDPRRAVELATKAAELAPKNAAHRGTLGTARYRAGDCKGAIADLEKALGLRKTNDPMCAYESFFIAMAHWQLGEKEQARTWFAKAVAWMEQGKKDDLQLQRFRAEAAELLEVEKQP